MEHSLWYLEILGKHLLNESDSSYLRRPCSHWPSRFWVGRIGWEQGPSTCTVRGLWSNSGSHNSLAVLALKDGVRLVWTVLFLAQVVSLMMSCWRCGKGYSIACGCRTSRCCRWVPRRLQKALRPQYEWEGRGACCQPLFYGSRRAECSFIALMLFFLKA